MRNFILISFILLFINTVNSQSEIKYYAPTVNLIYADEITGKLDNVQPFGKNAILIYDTFLKSWAISMIQNGKNAEFNLKYIRNIDGGILMEDTHDGTRYNVLNAINEKGILMFQLAKNEYHFIAFGEIQKLN